VRAVSRLAESHDARGPDERLELAHIVDVTPEDDGLQLYRMGLRSALEAGAALLRAGMSAHQGSREGDSNEQPARARPQPSSAHSASPLRLRRAPPLSAAKDFTFLFDGCSIHNRRLGWRGNRDRMSVEGLAPSTNIR